jgi:hypothetical protein
MRRIKGQSEAGSALSGARWVSACCFGLARDDVRGTRAFLTLADLKLHLLAFVKSGVAVHLDFRMMDK